MKKINVFAQNGDVTPVPDLESGGEVSWEKGYTTDYELPYDNPSSKDIERGKLNEIFREITQTISDAQYAGIYIWDVAEDYAQGELVFWNGKIYEENAGAGQHEQPDAPGQTQWQEVMGGGGGGGNISGTVVVIVPTNEPTVNDALNYLTSYFPAYNVSAIIEVHDTYTMAEAVTADGVDLSWIKIYAYGAGVTIDASALTGAAFRAFGGGKLRLEGKWTITGSAYDADKHMLYAASGGEIIGENLTLACPASCVSATDRGKITVHGTGTWVGYGQELGVIHGEENAEIVITGDANITHMAQSGAATCRILNFDTSAKGTISGGDMKFVTANNSKSKAIYIGGRAKLTIWGKITSYGVPITAEGDSELTMYIAGSSPHISAGTGTAVTVDGRSTVRFVGELVASTSTSDYFMTVNNNSFVYFNGLASITARGLVKAEKKSQVLVRVKKTGIVTISGTSLSTIESKSGSLVEIIAQKQSGSANDTKVQISSTTSPTLSASDGGVIRIRNCDMITSTTGKTLEALSGGSIEVENVLTKIESTGSNAISANGGDISVKRATLIQTTAGTTNHAVLCDAGCTVDVSGAGAISGKNSALSAQGGKIIARNCGALTGQTASAINATQGAHIDISGSGNITGATLGMSADESIIIAKKVGNITGTSDSAVKAVNGATIDASASGDISGAKSALEAANASISANGCASLASSDPSNYDAVNASQSKVEIQGVGGTVSLSMAGSSLILAGGTTTSGATPNAITADGLLLGA
jgi:hypothetical protein